MKNILSEKNDNTTNATDKINLSKYFYVSVTVKNVIFRFSLFTERIKKGTLGRNHETSRSRNNFELIFTVARGAGQFCTTNYNL